MIKKITLLLAVFSLSSCDLSVEEELTPYNAAGEFVHHVVETTAMIDELALGITIILPSSDNSCDARTYNSCVNGSRVKNFNGCKQGRTFTDGSATLVWRNSSGSVIQNCNLSNSGDKIGFTVNKDVNQEGGRASAVKSNGATSYSLVASSLGLTPVFVLNGTGTTKTISDKYKVSVQVSNPISVSGLNRQNRVMNNGTFLFSDLINSETCQLTPSSLVWEDSTCPCPTAGKIIGQCMTDSEPKNFFIQFTSCGRGNVAYGDYEGNQVYFPSCK